MSCEHFLVKLLTTQEPLPRVFHSHQESIAAGRVGEAVGQFKKRIQAELLQGFFLSRILEQLIRSEMNYTVMACQQEF